MNRRTQAHPHAFSLIEMIIVIVIIAIIGTNAMPRVSAAAGRAAYHAVVHDESALQRAIDRYIDEHWGSMPHHGAADHAELVMRLVSCTDDRGNPNAQGYCGPYLMTIPTNKINGLATIRIDGAAEGAGTHGWRYDSASGRIAADHSSATGYTQVNGSNQSVVTDAQEADANAGSNNGQAGNPNLNANENGTANSANGNGKGKGKGKS